MEGLYVVPRLPKDAHEDFFTLRIHEKIAARQSYPHIAEPLSATSTLASIAVVGVGVVDCDSEGPGVIALGKAEVNAEDFFDTTNIQKVGFRRPLLVEVEGGQPDG